MAATTTEAATTAKPPPQPSVICKKCNCSKKAKVVDCSHRNLTDLFTVEDWTALNSSEGNYEALKFDHNQLSNLSLQFPVLKFPIKKLDLSSNQIATLGQAMFKNLVELEEINLANNLIATVNFKPEIFEGRYSPDTYEPLKALKTLILTNNSLHSLHPDIFEHLPNVETLKLDSNVFQIVGETLSNAFSSILSLSELDMSFMEIEEMPDTIFNTNRNLKVLRLTGNLFRTVPKALRFAKSVEELSLDQNPLENINETL